MFKRKKEVEEYTVESFKETSVMLTTQNGSIEVQNSAFMRKNKDDGRRGV